MQYETLLIERSDEGIVKITMNRPDTLNAMNNRLLLELRTALEAIRNDESVKAVILTGSGRAFSAGLDVKEEEDMKMRFETVQDVFALLREIGAPVIAAVNGFAVTGGFELALNCDIVIASENASFRDTHARISVIPGGGNTQRLPRIIGEKRAKEILFTSDFVPAEQAEKWGLVNRVVPAERLDIECMDLARKVASQPGEMICKLKKMVDEGLGMDFRAALAYEQLESVTAWVRLESSAFRARGVEVINRGSGEVQAE